MALDNILKLGFVLTANDKMSAVISNSVKGSMGKVKELEKAYSNIAKSSMLMGKRAISMGAAIGGAMFASAKSVADYGDKILDASQKSGIGVVDLQKFAYAAERNNVSFETFTGNITKLNKKIVDLQAAGNKGSNVFKELGIRTGNINNTLIDTAKIFARIPDGAAKSALAIELFGKSGTDMIPFLNEGEAGINKLMKEAERMGIALSEDAILQADNFDTALGNLKFTLLGASRQLGSLLIPTVEKTVKRFQEIVEKVVAWARSNTELVKRIITFVSGLGKFLVIGGIVLTVFGALTATVLKFVRLARDVPKVIGTINKSLMLLAANPVVLIIAAITVAVIGLAFVFRHLWKTNEVFRNKVTEIWEKIKVVFSVALGFIKGIVQSVFGWMKDFWQQWGDTITEFFKAYFGFIWKIVKPILNFIWSYIKFVFGLIQAFWKRWGGTIKNIFSKVFGFVKAIFQTVINVVMGLMKVFTHVFKGEWGAAWEAVKDLFRTAWEGIKNIFIAWWEAIKSIFLGAWEVIKSIFEAINPIPWLTGIWDSFQTWFTDLKDRFMNWGKEIIQGLIDGIKAMFSKVVDAVSNVGNAIKDKFKGLLGISSPSTIFAQYGLNITQGLTGGIESGGYETARATEGLAMQTVRAAGNGVGGNISNISNIDNSAFGGITLNYSPVINISGGGGSASEDFMQALRSHKSEIARMMREVLENQRRIAFSN